MKLPFTETPDQIHHYQLTDEQREDGSRLNPTTLALLESRAFELRESLVNMEFESDPVLRAKQLSAYEYQRGCFDTLIGLITDARFIYQAATAVET